MRSAFAAATYGLAALLLSTFGCSCGDDDDPTPRRDAQMPFVDGMFVCFDQDSRGCEGNVFKHCVRDGEFFSVESEDCSAMSRTCTEEGCSVCRPNEAGCLDGNAVKCNEDGTAYDLVEECDITRGIACQDGTCRNLCEIALNNRSYQGCEFFAADLDNAGIAVGRDASAQQFAVVVSNPGTIRTRVTVEANRAPPGSPPDIVEIASAEVLPGDLEVFSLPRRELDGSSSNFACAPTDRACPAGETCICSRMDREPPCFCRVSATATGINDGTHSAVTSNAYRIRSALPIIAYQFNPLDNVGVFSNDSSLILPTSGIGERYTVVGWPQTIAHSDNPDDDFDTSRDDEDLRAFLTVVGTRQGTTVRVVLGEKAGRVVQIGGGGFLGPGQMVEVTLSEFDVLNLETQGLNADFTGTVVEATAPVSVFTGSEASDAPRFDDYSMRECCADHLEEQLFPDSSLGRTFSIARMPPRSKALNAAFVDPTRDSVGEPNEPEYVRILAISPGTTTIETTLPDPRDRFTLDQGEDRILEADRDFLIEASDSVAVLQTMASQDAVGIQSEYPGGDPAIIVVPPIEQHRQDYVFLTPSNYAFDFVVFTATRDTRIMLDGKSLDEFQCETGDADGVVRRPGDPPSMRVVHRCQLSFPDVIGLPNVRVEDGIQDDGVHTVVADQPIGVVVWGFDAYVSHAYAGGSNLTILN